MEADSGRIVGVIVFRQAVLPSDRFVAYEVLSLGVLSDRRRQYIGSDLKQSVMADAAACGIPFVISQVHKANYQMNALNRSLGVITSEWMDSDEYRMTAVRVRRTVRDRLRLRVEHLLGIRPGRR